MNQKKVTFILPILILTIALSLTYLPITKTQQSLYNTQHVRQLYTTNQNRTENVKTYCNDQTFTITSQQTTNKQAYSSTLATYFSGNSSQIVGYFITLDFAGLQTQTQTLGWGYILYAGPFVVGFIVLIFMWPFILCCCVCSESCPVQCCRKSKKEMYGKCELLIPPLSTAFLMILCIATSIPSMTRANPYFSKLQCSSSMFLDNILNGNVTEDGNTFFSGLTTMVEQFGYLKNNLSLLQTEISKLDGSSGTEMQVAENHANDALLSITTMPNGADTNQLSLSYSYPLHDTGNNTGTLNSVFADVLGTYVTDSTLTNTLYISVKTVKDSLQEIKNSSSQIAPQLTSGNMGANIDTVIDIINPLITTLQETDTLFSTVLSQTNNIDTYFDQYAVAFYGCILGFCVIVLTGLIFIKCFKMICCRYLLYFACLFIFFLCLVGFILSMTLSVSLPIMFYTCDYLTTSLQSGDNFKAMVNQIGGQQYEDFANYFSVCLSDGDGDILSTMSTSLNGQVDHLTTVIFNTANYDFEARTTSTNDVFDEVQASINNYGQGKIPDFDISSTFGSGQISFFNTISDKTAYSSVCSPGSYNIFYSDVWVPSTSITYQRYVDCLAKVEIDTTDCPSGIDSGCSFSRCLDTFDFLQTYNGAGGTAQIQTDIDSRYGTTCSLFNHHMTSFFTRYITVADDTIGNSVEDHADTNKVQGRFMQSRNKTDILLNYMDSDLKPLFQSINTNLENSTNSITDSNEGLLAGLNCKLMGEDLTRVTNSICTSMFNSLFFTFVTVGLISFGLLFSICCMVCTGIQHYKDFEKRKSKDIDKELMKERDTTAAIMDL